MLTLLEMFDMTQEMWVQSLGQEDPLKEGMATHSSILAWRIPRTEESHRLQLKGSQIPPGFYLVSSSGIYFSLSHSVQFISVTPSCMSLCDPMDCSTPGFLVHHQLPELTQTHHVHRVGDAIQSSHPLSSPSPLIFNLPQHQGLFK